LRFDVSWILGGIAQRPPEFIHRRIQAVLEIDEGGPSPNLFPLLLAGNQFACMRQQN
jgi:hypothetical protein